MGLFSRFFKSKKHNTIFVPTKTGYERKQLPDEVSSINEICAYLGYNIDKHHLYMPFDRKSRLIDFVLVEVFSSYIIFIRTKRNKRYLSKRYVDRFMNRFSVENEYGNYEIRNTLTEGIKNKTLDIDFLSKVLRIKEAEDTGIYLSEFTGCFLYVNNGFLADFRSADGLSVWAREWLRTNPDFLSMYEEQARLYWGEDTRRITNEINAQADAYASIPGTMGNQNIPLHRNRGGTINFVMLMVCHHGREMNLLEFLEINHGRYVQLNYENDKDESRYSCGSFVYDFSSDGSMARYQPLA